MITTPAPHRPCTSLLRAENSTIMAKVLWDHYPQSYRWDAMPQLATVAGIDYSKKSCVSACSLCILRERGQPPENEEWKALVAIRGQGFLSLVRRCLYSRVANHGSKQALVSLKYKLERAHSGSCSKRSHHRLDNCIAAKSRQSGRKK